MDTAIAKEATIGATIDRLMGSHKAYAVAAAIGMSDGTFRAVRKGNRDLKDAERKALAEFFGVPESTFEAAS